MYQKTIGEVKAMRNEDDAAVIKGEVKRTSADVVCYLDISINNQKQNEETTSREKTFATDTTNKGLISKINRQLMLLLSCQVM